MYHKSHIRVAVSLNQDNFALQVHLAISGKVVDCYNWVRGLLQTASGKRPEMLSNIPQCRGQPLLSTHTHNKELSGSKYQ